MATTQGNSRASNAKIAANQAAAHAAENKTIQGKNVEIDVPDQLVAKPVQSQNEVPTPDAPVPAKVQEVASRARERLIDTEKNLAAKAKKEAAAQAEAPKTVQAKPNQQTTQAARPADVAMEAGLNRTGYVDAGPNGSGEKVEYEAASFDELDNALAENPEGQTTQSVASNNKQANQKHSYGAKDKKDRSQGKQKTASQSNAQQQQQQQQQAPQRPADVLDGMFGTVENQNMPNPIDEFERDPQLFYGYFPGKPKKNEKPKTTRELYNERQIGNKKVDYSKEFPNEVPSMYEGTTTFADEVDILNTEPEDIDNRQPSERARKRAQEATRSVYKRGYLPIAGMYHDKDGRLRFPKLVEESIIKIQTMYKFSKTDVMRLVMLRVGLSVDVNGKILGVDPKEFQLTEDEFVAACQQIQASQKKHGHPLGLVDQALEIGGSIRYPVGVLPHSLARAMTKNNPSALNGISEARLSQMCAEAWVNQVHPEIIRQTSFDKKPEQHYALENMVRAIAGLDGVDPKVYRVYEVPMTYNEMRDQIRRESDANPDLADVYERQEQEIEKAKKRIIAGSKRIPVKDENGNVIGYRKKALSSIDGFFGGWASYMRLAGVVGNVPVVVSGNIEKVIGTGLTIPLAAWQQHRVDPRYRASENLRTQAKSEEAAQALQAIKMVYATKEFDAVTTFASLVSDGTYKPTEEDARKFINEWVKGIENPRKAQVVAARVARLTDKLIPGDFLFNGADATRFMDFFLANNGENGSPIDTARAEEIVRREGIGNFMVQAMLEDSGRQAFVSIRNFTAARVSPLSHLINRAMRFSGVTDFLITTTLDTYVNYGVNIVQLFTPFSNTMSYIAVRAATKDGAEIRNYQLGGNDAFMRGLVKNFMFDAMKIANFGAIAAFAYIIIGLLGFDEPEDEINKGKWDEYYIGGVKIRLAWWMNDLVGWGWPAAVAMHVNEVNPGKAKEVFWDGMYDMVDGISVLDMIEFVTNTEDNIQMMQEVASNPNADPGDKWYSNAHRMAESYWATILGKSTPSIFKTWYQDTFFVGQDARMKDARYVYDRSDEDGGREYVEDPDEIWRRGLSQRNPLYAIWNNLTKNQYLLDDGSTDKTGYLFWEQPNVIEKDPVRSYYMDLLEFDPKTDVPNGNAEEQSAWLEQNADNLITYIENEWETPEQAIANGFMIPYNARKNAIEYCYKQILLNKLDHVQRCEAGEYANGDEVYAASVRMAERNQYYYDLLDDWFKNDDIPWRDEGYEQWLTDYQIDYVWADSGQPATAWDRLMNGDAVEKHYKPYGNHPSSIMPISVVDGSKDYQGYNQETMPNWYVEGLTDTSKIFNQLQGATIPSGVAKNEDAASVVFGGQENPLRHNGEAGNPYAYNINPETGEPVMGYRSYIPSDEALPDSLKDINEDAIAKMLGIDLDELDDDMDNAYDNAKKNYNTWRSYGGGSGSGGSSYNPKIYSNPRSVNASRPATMYSKQPYGATTTYLRPAFYTKGSREAYRRQDL